MSASRPPRSASFPSIRAGAPSRCSAASSPAAAGSRPAPPRVIAILAALAVWLFAGALDDEHRHPDGISAARRCRSGRSASRRTASPAPTAGSASRCCRSTSSGRSLIIALLFIAHVAGSPASAVTIMAAAVVAGIADDARGRPSCINRRLRSRVSAGRARQAYDFRALDLDLAADLDLGRVLLPPELRRRSDPPALSAAERHRGLLRGAEAPRACRLRPFLGGRRGRAPLLGVSRRPASRARLAEFLRDLGCAGRSGPRSRASPRFSSAAGRCSGSSAPSSPPATR